MNGLVRGRQRRWNGSLWVLAMAMVGVALAGCNTITARPTSQSPSASHVSSSHTAARPSTAGVPFTVGAEKYRVAVTALYRSGPFMRLGFELTCVKDAGDNAANACAPDEDFGLDPYDQTYGGFYLVDPVRHKEYLPVQTKDGGGAFTSQADYIGKGRLSTAGRCFPPRTRARAAWT